MYQLTIAVTGADSLQNAIRQAREIALHSPEKWAHALSDLSGAAENDVIFAAMDGDECHAGRVLIQRLRDAVIAEATQATKDAIADAAFEVEYRETLGERRTEESMRAHKASMEGTP